MLCLLAAGVGLSVLPFNVGGLLLLVAGFVLFGLEVWVGGHGVLGIAGFAGVISGGVLLFEVEGFDLKVAPVNLVVVGVASGACALLIGFLVVRAQRGRVAVGRETLVGRAVLLTEGGPGRGRVFIEGEDWKATFEGELATGTDVVIERVEGLVLHVTRNKRGS